MDVERTIEFLVQNQARFEAQFSARLDELGSWVGRIAEQQLALTQHVDHFQREISGATLALAQEQLRLTEEQRRLAEAQERLAEAQERLTEAQERLADTQRHTDERMNALIAVVDGIVRKPPQ